MSELNVSNATFSQFSKQIFWSNEIQHDIVCKKSHFLDNFIKNKNLFDLNKISAVCVIYFINFGY